MTTPARTRFAPSPTGFQHIGGFRTAFYAWLLAKKTGGEFLLRIEDTDQERLVPGAIRYILEELAWFGVTPDEGPSREELKKLGEDWDGAPNLGTGYGPYVQSQRLPMYKATADKLIELGVAYRCDCTPEMLEKERSEQMARRETPGYSGYCRARNVSPDVPHVVRFKMPARKTVLLEDAIRGRIQWDNIPLRDPVLLKSDGFPTYHLACVVDDNAMKITHVMRGEEWLATAPLHVMLYEALGWPAPKFAHLPVVKGSDGKKLSKRHGATLASAFRDDGYLPEALLNYVVLVGWSPGEGDNQEIFTRDELIKKFSLEHVNEASAVFDYTKLQWMNGMYIRALPIDVFIEKVMPFLTKAGLNVDPHRLRVIAPALQERIKTLAEAPSNVEFLFKESIVRDWGAVLKKDMTKEKASQYIEVVKLSLEKAPHFNHDAIEAQLKSVAEELSVKPGAILPLVRIAVTGQTATPPLYASMEALGKEATLKRLIDAQGDLAN